MGKRSGKIGLFDTKAGQTAQAAGPRAEGLAKYIEKQNKKGKNYSVVLLLKMETVGNIMILKSTNMTKEILKGENSLIQKLNNHIGF